jgi:hypothetical protein
MLVQRALFARAAVAVLAAILARDYAEDDGPVCGQTCETLLALFGREGARLVSLHRPSGPGSPPRLRGACRSKADERQARLAGTPQQAPRKRGGEHERFERSDHDRVERSDDERQARLAGARQQAPRKRGGEPGRFGRQVGLSLKVHDTAALRVAFSGGPKKNAPSTLGRTLQAVSAAA